MVGVKLVPLALWGSAVRSASKTRDFKARVPNLEKSFPQPAISASTPSFPRPTTTRRRGRPCNHWLILCPGSSSIQLSPLEPDNRFGYPVELRCAQLLACNVESELRHATSPTLPNPHLLRILPIRLHRPQLHLLRFQKMHQLRSQRRRPPTSPPPKKDAA